MELSEEEKKLKKKNAKKMLKEYQKSKNSPKNHLNTSEPTKADVQLSTDESATVYASNEANYMCALTEPTQFQREIDEVFSYNASAQPIHLPTQTIIDLSREMADNASASQQYAGTSSGYCDDRLASTLENAQQLDNLPVNSDEWSVMNGRISELEHQLMLSNETNKNNEMAVKLLTQEKSLMYRKIEVLEQRVKEKEADNVELSNRLQASRSVVSELKRETAELKERNTLPSDLDATRDQLSNVKDELAQLFKQYAAKEAVLNELHETIKEKDVELQLSRLKIEQLNEIVNGNRETNDTTDIEIVKQLKDKNDELEQQLATAQRQINEINNEKSQITVQYQNYVSHLEEEKTKLTEKLQQLTKENGKLMNREISLVQHITQLETKIQTVTNQTVNPTDDEKNSVYESKIVELQQENYNKVKEIDELQAMARNLRDQLDSLAINEREMRLKYETLREQMPDHSKLIAAMESDKATASQAVRQNAKLMQQYEQLQNEIVKFNDIKLELTQKLQKEQHLGHEILKRLELSQNENVQLKQTIEHMQEQLDKFKAKSQLPQTNEGGGGDDGGGDDGTLSVGEAIRNFNLQNFNGDIRKYDESVDQVQQHKYMPESDAMKQLEERFTQKMQEVAELREERQRLEHLVLQLQSETETIGEYVALYQHQRALLKQRSHERENQLELLNKDRDEIKKKLFDLKNRIYEYIMEQISGPQRINRDLDLADLNAISDTSRAQNILELINQINACALITKDTYTVDVGAMSMQACCPLCSGQILTV